MAGSWLVVLDGVALAGGDIPVDRNDPNLPAVLEEDVRGYLSYPPEGLGLPGLRVEDQMYPQRDGVEHFSDWYEPRILTLQEVVIGGEICSCEGPRADARAIMEAWSRKCDDVELVIWPPDCDSDDPELIGPYGMIGRPRVAELVWQRSGENIGVALLRFDAVDHRLYLLDEDGTPGSGQICTNVNAGLYPNTYVDEFALSSTLVDQHYPLSLDSRDSLFGPNANGIIDWPDKKFFATSVVVDDLSTDVGWTVSGTGGAGPTGLGYDSAAHSVVAFASLTSNPWTLILTRPGSVSMGGMGILWIECITSLAISVEASFSGGGYISAISNYRVSNSRRIIGFVAPSSFTSVAFRIGSNTYAGALPSSASIEIRRVGRGLGRGALYPAGNSNSGQPQILPGAASTSLGQRNLTLGGRFQQPYTTGMTGLLFVGDPSVATSKSLVLGNAGSNHFVTFIYDPSTDTVTGYTFWGGSVVGTLNSFVCQVLLDAYHGVPTFVVVTWSSTFVKIWTSTNNPANPSTPKLAQTMTVSASVPQGSDMDRIEIPVATFASDVISGVDHYSTDSTVNTFITNITTTAQREGIPVNISTLGNVCADLIITFTGAATANPIVRDSSGDFVGVSGDFADNGFRVAVIDTSSGTLTIDGVVRNDLLTGNPFFNTFPGETLEALGGGLVQICYRPAVMSA